MFENMMSLELKEAVYANSVPVWVAKERTYSVIVIRISGTGVYGFDDKEITVGPGEGIFFPKGSTDTFRLLSENGRYVRIHFNSDGHPGRPEKFIVDDMNYFLTAFDKLRSSLLFDNKKKKLLSISHFYEILSLLSTEEEKLYFNSEKITLIEPALRYLEEHLYDSDLVVGNLCDLCEISNVYLRRIFVKYTGKSPGKYVTEKRLEKAKSILDNGEYTLISNVAERVGYTNPFYFSRIFKKYYGYTPSECADKKFQIIPGQEF